LQLADVDGDHKLDLIVGNVGDNFYLQPTKEAPAKLFVNDFDKNGIKDKVITYTIDGKDKPVVVKRDLEEQIPYIKKHNLKHVEYAQKSVQEIFSKEDIDQSLVKAFNYTSSIVAYNNGNGQFEIQQLPAMAQLSSVQAILLYDVNMDGKLDVLLGGNNFNYAPQYERLDASFGDVLINKGSRKGFVFQDEIKTGLLLKGQVKDIKSIRSGNKDVMIYLINNEKPKLYQLNR
jgi:hypothetical protein